MLWALCAIHQQSGRTSSTTSEGATIDVAGWLTPAEGRAPAVVVSVAHLDEDDRARARAVARRGAGVGPRAADRALSNAGMWFVGRLQTDADRERVVEGMATDGAGPSRAELSSTVKKLAKRWFVLRDVHAPGGAVLAQPRFAITWMRGPFTRVELRSALARASR